MRWCVTPAGPALPAARSATAQVWAQLVSVVTRGNVAGGVGPHHTSGFRCVPTCLCLGAAANNCVRTKNGWICTDQINTEATSLGYESVRRTIVAWCPCLTTFPACLGKPACIQLYTPIHCGGAKAHRHHACDC